MYLLSNTMSFEKEDLNTASVIDEMIENVKIFIEEKNIPKGEWIQGRRWNQERFHKESMGQYRPGSNGIPTDKLRENAMELVYKLIPPSEKDRIKEMITKAAGDCLSFGITLVQTDDFGAIEGDFKDILNAYF